MSEISGLKRKENLQGTDTVVVLGNSSARNNDNCNSAVSGSAAFCHQPLAQCLNLSQGDWYYLFFQVVETVELIRSH